MTAVTRDKARDAAVRDYTEAWRQIMAEAKEAQKSGRPLKAARLRWIAAKVHAAAVSEDADEQPAGLP